MLKSDSLEGMLRAYRGSHPLLSDKMLAQQFKVSPAIIGEVRSGNYEKRVRRALSEGGKINALRSLAGTVSRLARGCGEDEKEWLKKLGFPEGIEPQELPDESLPDNLVLDKGCLDMLQKVVEAVGPIPLKQAVGLLTIRANRPRET